MNISVAMATYNGAKFLEEQIESILLQTLKPAEIIVCDDGSTDDTTKILEKYMQQGSLKYLINSSRLGLINNFKKAVSLCDKNNYIALSDQDDVWLPDKLKKLSALMAETEEPHLPCMVYGDLALIDEDKNILNQSFRNEAGQDQYRHNLESLLYNNFVNGCATLINPAFQQYFDEIPKKVYINHDGWLALVAYTFGKAKGINESVVLYRKHNANFSIATDYKKRNRYTSVLKQVLDAVKNQDHFLNEQFIAIGAFNAIYRKSMNKDAQDMFASFLKLKGKSYLAKKLAYRQMIKRLKV